MSEEYVVWLDQDLCTGDGICFELAPDIFFGHSDGLYYVKEATDKTGLGLDGEPKNKGTDTVKIPVKLLNDVIDAAEECPGTCIYLERKS